MKRLFITCLMLLVLPCITIAGALPDTGQTKCYDNTQEITCPDPGEDFYGQDANYAPCNPHSYAKLDESGNPLPDDALWPWAMVRDNVTGLIWEVKTDDGSMHDKDNLYTWGNAQSVFTSSLNNDNFGGYSDWRLPTIKELSSIVDNSIPEPGPTINTGYFYNTMSSRYWSFNTRTRGLNDAWVIYFNDGFVGYEDKLTTFYVRAVRGEQSTNNFVDNGDGTITDTSTDLVWEVKTDDGGSRDKDNTYAWQQALSYCENLSHAGYDDWRLPNRNELQSIVDYTRYNPSIDPIFSNTVSSWYWSSTTEASNPLIAWMVEFYDGYTPGSSKSAAYYYVRAVRSGQCSSFIDSDSDGIPDDGDNSGIAGDNPCTGGLVTNCDDNCPNTSNLDQLDSYPPGGNGCGDACECHADCNGDQTVNLTDLVVMKQQFFRTDCATNPCSADCNWDDQVNLTDLVMMKQEFFRSDCPACP